MPEQQKDDDFYLSENSLLISVNDDLTKCDILVSGDPVILKLALMAYMSKHEIVRDIILSAVEIFENAKSN